MIELDLDTLKWLGKEAIMPLAVWLAIRLDIKLIHSKLKDLAKEVERTQDRVDILFDKHH